MIPNVIMRYVFLIYLMLSCMVLSGEDIESPLFQSFAYYPYQVDTLLGTNNFSMNVNLSCSNLIHVFRYSLNETDMEIFSGIWALRYGLFKKTTIELYIKNSYANPGILDGFISWFHNTFGFPNDSRDLVDDFRVAYRFKDEFGYVKEKFVLHSPVLSSLTQIFSYKKFKAKLRFGLGIPVNHVPGFTAGRFFFTVGIINQFTSRDFKVSLSKYFSFFKKPEWLGSEYLKSNVQFFFRVKLNYKWMIFGATFRTSPIQDKYYSSSGSQLMFGISLFKGRIE